MFCKKCGLKMPKGDKYCRECGTEYKILPEDKKMIKSRWLTWIMVVIIIICLIGVGYRCFEYDLWEMLGIYLLQIVNGFGIRYGY